MAKRRKKKKDIEKKPFPYRYLITGLVFVLIAIFGMVPNKFGVFGNAISSIFIFLFGNLSFVFLLFLLLIGGYLILNRESPDLRKVSLIGVYLITFAAISFIHVFYLNDANMGTSEILSQSLNLFIDNMTRVFANENIVVIRYGYLGILVASLFRMLFSTMGAYIVNSVIAVLGLILLTGIDLFEVLKNKLRIKQREHDEEVSSAVVFVKEKDDEPEAIKPPEKEVRIISSFDELTKFTDHKETINEVKEEKSEEVVEIHQEEKVKPNTNYQLPSLDLLKDPAKPKQSNKDLINRNITLLQQVLLDFGVVGKVVAVTEGPAVTQYELELNSGTKVNKLLGLTKEISLALAKKDVRIEAPIPGKSTVGIELPNDFVNPVSFKEIMSRVPASKKNSKLLVSLGKNIMGEPIFCEIDKTPHLLVAGATGSGKSVCINGIISSLIMRTTPDEVKLVLIDPKKVEFSMYNGIPHLLTPVVTDPKKANVALQKIVSEMERRYSILSDQGVKNITAYNEMIDKKNKKVGADAKLPHMHYIVAIIDELADLMLVASKEVEDSIMRITQMARAAGIHLIVATQRPSTDIITGVVKANIPSRISFAVSSSIDSRTILDQTGAEKLLGKGDMLFLPMGENSPLRVQGAYVSDQEVEKLVEHTVNQQKATYSEEFNDLSVRPSVQDVNNQEEEYDDPLYNEIVEFVIMTGKVSASMLQRKYRIGFNRAARVVDLLEERGIIGPQNGSKPREVLVKYEESE